MSYSSPSPRWWDLRAALLLLVALFVIASRLTATGWTEQLQIAYIITFLGWAAGLALGQSRFGLKAVLPLALVFGLFVIGWQLGAPLEQSLEWRDRLLNLVGRLSVTGLQFARQQPVQDPLLALLLFASLFWILSLQAGYALTRQADPWQATLPGGLALLVIHTYDQRPQDQGGAALLWAAGIYFIVSLLLLARLSFLRRRAQWQARRVNFSPQVDSHILSAALLAALTLAVIAWTAPLTPNVLPPARDLWAIVTRPWGDVRARFGNAFTSLRAAFGAVNDRYSDHLNLGRGSALSDTVVLEVEAPARPEPGVRYYWRAWTYDIYQPGGWASSFKAATQAVTPEDFDLALPRYAARWESKFTFTPRLSILALYTPAQPGWVSRPALATGGKDENGKVDLIALEAPTPVLAGESYQVEAALSAATVTQLRGAGANYPQWIKDHYLQLPEITDRTRTLAREIAAPYANAYDIAEAVTNYLRRTIKYSETVETPPLDQDVIDWFLFDYRQGFCNYYATAEIVLLRSLGIPARLAAGYARGQANVPETLDPLADEPTEVIYLVRDRDAHAWPEVYFPAYGWVEFEPTVSQDPIVRPVDLATGTGVAAPIPTPPTPDPAPPLEEADPDPAAANAPKPNNLWLIMLWFMIPAGLIGLAILGWKVRQRMALPPLPVVMERGLRRLGLTPPPALQEWARLASLSPVEKAYQEVNGALKRLGAPPTSADTPTERVAALKRLLPEAAAHASRLLAEYHLAVYSAKSETGNPGAAEYAGQCIRRLSWRAAVGRNFKLSRL